MATPRLIDIASRSTSDTAWRAFTGPFCFQEETRRYGSDASYSSHSFLLMLSHSLLGALSFTHVSSGIVYTLELLDISLGNEKIRKAPNLLLMW